jgi:hypothetical protein
MAEILPRGYLTVIHFQFCDNSRERQPVSVPWRQEDRALPDRTESPTGSNVFRLDYTLNLPGLDAQREEEGDSG